MKKLLYCPLGSQPGLEIAFARKFELKIVESPNNFINNVVDFKPDIVHMQIQGSQDPSPEMVVTAKKKHPFIVTQWCGDQRIGPYKETVAMAKIANLTLISARGQCDMYRQTGILVDYWQHAADAHTDFIDPFLPNENRQDGIVFVGNCYDGFPASKQRLELLQALTREFDDFYVYGNGWEGKGVRTLGPINIRHASMRYHRAKVSIGIDNFLDVDCGFSDRTFIAMASGTAYVYHKIPGDEKYFTNGKNCLKFTSSKECIQLIHLLLKDSNLLRQIGNNGATLIRQKHTWDSRVEEYIELLNKYKLGV